jgi:hypothetical protein
VPSADHFLVVVTAGGSERIFILAENIIKGKIVTCNCENSLHTSFKTECKRIRLH